jgi:hypothetical protein
MGGSAQKHSKKENDAINAAVLVDGRASSIGRGMMCR